MSETITEPVPQGQVGGAAPVDQQQTETQVQTEQQDQQPDQPQAEPDKPPEQPKPKRTDRHIAHLTARAAEEQRLREAAERRAEAAEALLRANRPDGDDQPVQQPRTAPVDVETRAAQLVQERQFNARLAEIDQTGKRDIGAEQWEQAKQTMTGLGAVNSQPFLQALAEADNPHKIFAALADDPDTLVELLAKPPAALAAKIGKMDAEMSRPAARPLSAAPTPAPRIQPSGVVPEPDPTNYPPNMSMREWNKMMDNFLPPSLGGKKRPA